MLRCLTVVAAVVAVCAVAPSSASAISCVAPATPEESAAARADVVLEGIALSGERTPGGALSATARVLVTRYRRGTGPRVVRVATSTVLYRFGVIGEIGGGFSPAVGDAVRVTGDRVQRLRHSLTGALLERGTILPDLCFGTGTFSPRRLLTARPGRATSDGWSAVAQRGTHGLECVRYAPPGATHFDECERLSARRPVGVGTAIDLGGAARPPSTGVVAYGPGLRSLEARVGDEVRTATPPRPGAPAVVAFPGRVERYDIRIRTTSTAGERVRTGDRSTRVFADDPGGLPAWGAGSADDPGGERCAFFSATTPRYPRAVLDGDAGELCRRAPAGASLVGVERAGCSAQCPPEVRDVVRTVVFGRAGRRVTRVTLDGPGGTRDLPLARRGGAFLAVLEGDVARGAITVTLHSPSGAVSVRGRRSTVVAG